MVTRRDRVGERRWLMTAAVLLTGVLRVTLPPQLRVNDARPVLLVVLLGLIIALIMAHPGRIDRQSTWLRVLTALPIVLEPGRAIAGPAGVLLATVIDVKPRTAASDFAGSARGCSPCASVSRYWNRFDM